MLDKRIEFKGEYGISMRIEPSGEFTTAFVGVGGGFTTEYIEYEDEFKKNEKVPYPRRICSSSISIL